MKYFAYLGVPVGLLLSLPSGAFANSMPRVDDIKVVRTMVTITTARFGNYYASPTAKEPTYNMWSWLPRSSFYLRGAMPPGGQVSIAFTTSDGSPWLTVPLIANKVGDSNYYYCANDYSTQESGKPAKTATGSFGFKIMLKDPLAGTNTVLYTGKYTVGKFHKGPDLPVNKNQFEYYVDQDWRLPIGFVTADYAQSNSDNPQPQIKVYLKGDPASEQLEGVLYCDGKMIASKEMRGGSAYSKFKMSTAGLDKGDPQWGLWSFSWGSVRMFVPEFNKQADTWYLSEHPGKYELKVLREGTLARSVKFTVGEKGAFVDGGFGKAADDEVNAIVPVKILGTTDGKWDPTAWKTGAFYGNPLKDFDGTQ